MHVLHLNALQLQLKCTHSTNCMSVAVSIQFVLYLNVNIARGHSCIVNSYELNDAQLGRAVKAFKLLFQRLNFSNHFLESNEGDPELLIFIPFTSDVKIKSISVIGGAGGASPSKMRAFINRDDIDFSDAQNMQSVQDWELAENLQGLLEYQTRYARFQSVASLTLHFPVNFGAETTKIFYIGLRGEATQLKRDAVANIVYELYPNPSEHK
ncbi:hypothetical protein KSP40_PGU003477 [Platanthera guangdongensis]|uniref:PITH domain-containing protein n=1 Tax=Platanthera guangdongensis TaxID=2320717 RepID=A0ABR2N414_9ASPA